MMDLILPLKQGRAVKSTIKGVVMYQICGIELSKIQSAQVQILKAFDKICRENNLKYSIEGGTLLGAYKYGGFVPWDDDIDVVMLRADYEKFLQIASKINNGMSVHTYKNDKYLVLNYCKYRMNGTVYKEQLNAHLTNMDHGLFIDIFPLDNVVLEDLEKQKKKIRRLFKLRWSKLGYRKKKLIDKFIGLIPNSWIVHKTDKQLKKWNSKQTDFVYEICNPSDKFAPIPKKWFENIIDVNFCGVSVMAVSAYQEYIQARFGDISGLPPQEEQKPSHQIVEVKLLDE